MTRASLAASLVVGTVLVVAALACGRSHDGFTEATDAGPGVPSFVDDDAAIHQCSGQGSSSLGCEYLAVHMDGTFDADNGCFVVFLANSSPTYPAHVDAQFDGTPIDLSRFAKTPRGTGRSLTYATFDPNAGIAPGDVAILFLAGPPKPGAPSVYSNDPVPCPVKPALSALTQIHGSGFGESFRIRTDQAVAANQMLPY